MNKSDDSQKIIEQENIKKEPTGKKYIYQDLENKINELMDEVNNTFTSEADKLVLDEIRGIMKTLLTSCQQYEILLDSLKKKSSQQENILLSNATRIHELENTINELKEKNKPIH